jgi:guanine nucleotide-binding protein subunit alpha
MKYVLDAMEDMELKISEDNLPHIDLIENASDLRDGEPFPVQFYEPLKSLWLDPNVRAACIRGNEAALPEKYFLPTLHHTISRLTFPCHTKFAIFLFTSGPAIRPTL